MVGVFKNVFYRINEIWQLLLFW